MTSHHIQYDVTLTCFDESAGVVDSLGEGHFVDVVGFERCDLSDSLASFCDETTKECDRLAVATPHRVLDVCRVTLDCLLCKTTTTTSKPTNYLSDTVIF